MRAKQLSIFLENRSGRLHEVTEVLGRAGINIRALSLADTSDFGILRLIVDRPEDAYRILREEGFTVRESEVMAVEVSDQPGGLSEVLEIFRDGGINVEYMYAFVEKAGRDAYRLSELGRAMVRLARGRPRGELSDAERAFLLGVLMLDGRLRRIAAELIATGESSDPDEFMVGRVRLTLQQLGFLEPESPHELGQGPSP